MTNSTIKHVSFPGPFSHAADLFSQGTAGVKGVVTRRYR
jgi:hypothetical protein